jgi:hypothetical protein
MIVSGLKMVAQQTLQQGVRRKVGRGDILEIN